MKEDPRSQNRAENFRSVKSPDAKAIQASASRKSARQSQAGRVSTRCFAARASEVRLLVGSVTQRKMQFRAVPCAPPNPSIERTLPGKPVSASHVKR